MPLKLLLLVIAMAMFGLNTYAQTGKSVKVANDQQLIEAMVNPSVSSIELSPGYYAYIDHYAETGDMVFMKDAGNGSRSTQCLYFIIGRDVCFDPANPGDFVGNIARAGTTDPFFCNCCPPDDTGIWSVESLPSGTANINLLSPLNQQDPMNFEVDEPGPYVLRYTWGPPYNSLVETEYNFFGPVTVDLSAPDVCGLSTLVSYVRTSDFEDPDTDVEWFLNGDPYDGPEFTEDFILTVDWCGYWELSVTVTPTRCGPVTETIWIDFSCQPVADAGEDAYLCYENCYYSLVGGTGLGTWSPTHAFSWVQISGPGTLVFDNEYALTTFVCAEDLVCLYGEYEVQLQIQNGMCYDEDEVTLIFYEQPEADAGADFILCDEFAFSLNATPFPYCGDEGVNYWSHAWWELVQAPGMCNVVFDEFDPNTSVYIDNCTGCEYGDYWFVWYEVNVKIDPVTGDTLWSEQHCVASDSVKVTIYEQPMADAGDDFWACVDAYMTPYTYMMDASGYGREDYCYTMYGMWTKSCGPGEVTFVDIYDPNTIVYFHMPGRYIFNWKLWNEACEDEAEVLFDYLEQPEALANGRYIQAECDSLCVDLADALVVKYDYFGTDAGDCPNYFDRAHWILIEGPDGVDPLQAQFADDTDPQTTLCVSWYGGYTVGWVELNKPDDKDYYCSDTVLIYVEFFETPYPFAGDDDEICDNCYTLEGIPHVYSGPPNQHGNDYYYWEYLIGSGPGMAYIDDFESAVTEVCIDDDFWGTYYGTYGFVFHQSNGECFSSDTVYITFYKNPDPIDLCFWNSPNDCNPWNYGGGNGPRGFDYSGCLEPGGLLEVCADGFTCFEINPWCGCSPFFPLIEGWTYEWSVIAPAGTIVNAEPGWYDFYNGMWNYPYLCIEWGECCDTARIYLTITTPDCEETYEYKVYVHHQPCADIQGPEVAEIEMIETYCYCEPPTDDSCLLYTWAVEHCGIIVGGQGTPCVDVLWTDYNINDGWGKVSVTVLDTCTGCCAYDEMDVKVYPPGTIGDSVLYGYVYYHNVYQTPLNGVEVQLWNSGIPVMSTTSFNDIEGGMGMGFYAFPNVNGLTLFDITASYDAPWYGANATDALAVELHVINSLPMGFLVDDVVEEAMDVNNSTTISALDALWIKQRAINMVNYFPAGDWAFADTSASAADSPFDIMTLNYGDANRSNIPNSMKAAPAIDLIADGVMNVVTGEEFLLPIRVAEASQFGAITLDLGFSNSTLEVVDVIAPEGMVTNILNGNVSIAWSSLNPMVLAANDAVITLKVIALDEVAASDMLFNIGLNSEFASPAATVIEPVTLKTYGISTSPAAEDYFMSANRPNPFSTTTFIEYTLPETGKVRLSVIDMLGQEIAVLVESTQTAGSYTVEFSGTGLATGVYLYKITVDGETRDYISTQRMVISH